MKKWHMILHLTVSSAFQKKEKPVNGEIGAPLSGGAPAPEKKVLEGVLDKLKK